MRPDGKPGKDSGTTTPEALIIASLPVKKLKDKAERAKENNNKSDDEEEPRKDDYKKDVEGSAATHSSLDGKPKRKRRKLVDTEKLALLLWRVILDHGGSCHADTLAEYAFRDWSLLAPSITLSSSSSTGSSGQGLTSSSNPQSSNKGESAAFRPIIPSRASLEDVKKLVHQALESNHQIPFASLYELSNPLYLYKPLYDLTLPKDSFTYNPIAQIALADIRLPSEVTSKALAQILHNELAHLSSLEVSKEVPNGNSDSTAQDDTSATNTQKESQEKGDASSSQMNTDEPKVEDAADGETNKTKAIATSEELRDDTHVEETAIDLVEKAKYEELLRLEKMDRHTKDLRRVAFKPDPLLDGCFTLTGDSYAPPHIVGPPDSQMSSLVSALLPIMEVANNSLQLDRIAQLLIAQWSLLQAYPRQDVNIEMITHATHITLLTHPKFERDGSAQDEFFRIVSQSRRRRSTIPAAGTGATGNSSTNAGGNSKSTSSNAASASGNASTTGNNASNASSNNHHHHHDATANSSAAASSHAKHAASPSAPASSAAAKKGAADSRTAKASEPAARASTRLTDATSTSTSTSNSAAAQSSTATSTISATALNAAASATLPSPSARMKRNRRGAEKETSASLSSKAQATSPSGSKSGSSSHSASSALGRSKWGKNGEFLVPSQSAAPFHASVAAECAKFYGTTGVLTARLRPGPGFACMGCKTKKSERWFHGPNPSDWHCSTCGEAWSIEHTCPICGLVYENDDDDHDHSSSEEESEEEDVESAASDDEGHDETHDEDASDDDSDDEDDEEDEESGAEKNDDHLASSSGMDVDASESDSKTPLVKKEPAAASAKAGESAKMEVDGESAAPGSSSSAPTSSSKNEDAGEEEESLADGKKDGEGDDDELDDTNEESATAGEARKRRKRRKSTFRKSTYPKASKSKAKRLKSMGSPSSAGGVSSGASSSGTASATTKTPSKSSTSGSSSKSPKTPSSSSKSSSKSAKKSTPSNSSSSRHSSRKSASSKGGRSGYGKKSKGKSSGSSQSQGAQSSWIACDQCNRWVMSGCEGIVDLSVYDDSNPNHLDYHCSICRGLLGAMPSVFYTKSTAKFFVGDLKDAKRYVSSGQFLKDMNAVLAAIVDPSGHHMDVSDPSDSSTHAAAGEKDAKDGAHHMAISSPSAGTSKASEAKSTGSGANSSKKTTARTAAAASAAAAASTASASSATPSASASASAAFNTPKQAAAKHVSPVSASAPRNGASAAVASPVPAPDLGRGARRGGATANAASSTSAVPNAVGAQTSPAEINRTAAALNDAQAQPKAHNGTAPNNGWNFASGPASVGGAAGALPGTPIAEPTLNFVHPTTPVAHLTLGMHPLSTPVFVLNARLAAALDPNVTFGRIESEMLRLAETTLLGQQQQLKAAFDLAMLQAEEAEVRQKANGPASASNGETASATNGEIEPTRENNSSESAPASASQDASSTVPPTQSSAMDVSQSPSKNAAPTAAAVGEEARAQNGPIPSRPLPPLSEKSKQSLALLEQRFQEEVLNMRSLMANSMAHIMDQHRLDSERAILALLEEREQLDAQAERIILEQFQQFSAVKTRQLLAKTLSLYQTECPALHSAALPPLPPGTIPNPTTSIFASSHPSTNGDYSAQLHNIALATQRPPLAPQANGESDGSSSMDLDTAASALAGSQHEDVSSAFAAAPSAAPTASAQASVIDGDVASPSTTVHLQHLPHKPAAESKTSAPTSPARKTSSDVSRSAPSSAPGSPKKAFGRNSRDSSFLNQGLQTSSVPAATAAPAAPPQPTEAELAAQRQREEEEQQKREEEERLQKEAEAARLAAEEEEAAKKAAEEAKRRSEADAKISESLWPTEDNETFGGPPAIIDAPAPDPSAADTHAATENTDQAVPSEESEKEPDNASEDVSAFMSENPSSMDVDTHHAEDSNEAPQADAKEDDGAADSEMALD